MNRSRAGAPEVFPNYVLNFQERRNRDFVEVILQIPMLTKETQTQIDQIWNMLSSGGISNQLELLAKYSAYLPPVPLQREFARRVGAVEKLQTAQRAPLAELDALFVSLQHGAFRGEVS